MPLSSGEVDQRVSAFRLLGEDVRRNLPDILVAAMTALHSQYQGMKAKGQVRKYSSKLRQFLILPGIGMTDLVSGGRIEGAGQGFDNICRNDPIQVI